ncbi:oligosaccharide flippase family protein [Maribacter confluentis]|uniref:Oligosaccharide flippase family protein n=1 Tax=Maribacter confluentis TaxID=1656093 RepID=A0ABT8RRB1_9FLAO|nr:polysaccharide biosynthesis C-terminal domain-containing protein [Maribacter confluentis]MDO1512942.1 oligosaccharide flippase family protein [Maribacter confluentis]
MKSLRHNTIYLVGANSLQVALGLIFSIFLARYFEQKEAFGKYQQLFVIINFLVSFSSGIPMGLSYFFGTYLDYTSRIKIYKRFWWSMFFLALGLGGILFLFNTILADFFQNNYFREYSILFCGLLTLKIINSYYLQYYLTRGKLQFYFVVIITEFVLTIILVIAISLFNLQIKDILTGLILISLTKLIVFGSNSLLVFKIKGPIILSKKEFEYILPMIAISMASLLTIYTDKFMISSILNPESFAEYQVGAFSIPFIGIITGSVVTALIPALAKLKSEGDIHEIKIQLRNATKKTSLFLVPILIYCILLGPHLITALYTETYKNSGYIFQLYTASYLLTVIAFSAVMNAIGLQKWVLLNTILNLSLNVILNLILIPKYGNFGAVYATLASTYLGYFLPIHLLRKQISANFLEYFPIRFYSKILLLSTVLALFILYLMNHYYLNKWFAFIMAVPFYFIILIIAADKSILDKNQVINRIKKIGRK